MTINGWLQILLFIAIIIAVAKPVGIFMTHVFNGERTFLHFVLRPVERLIYRLTGVDEKREMRWTEYAAAMLLFSVVSLLLLYLIQRLQGYLPLNPQKLPGVDSAAFTGSSFNTAASFTTNTNWQSYVPETTMSYFTQMAGLAYHNFASAATGIVLAIAFIRGIARREMQTIGNFWVDFVRCNLYVLLPICVLGALLLVSQGVIQNFRPYDTATLVEPQTIQVDKKDASGNVLTNPDGTNQKRGPEGHGSNHRAGASCFAGVHQGIGHQRRWFLQCQLGASLRESDSVYQLHRDAGDLHNRRRSDLLVGPHDRSQKHGWRCWARW